MECIKQREGRVVEMNDILFCLDRVNRVLETKNRRLGSEAGYDHYSSDDEENIESIEAEDDQLSEEEYDHLSVAAHRLSVMHALMREGILEGVENARRMAGESTDNKAIAAMFRDQLYEIIGYKNTLRSGIRQGLMAGVQQARKQSGVNKTQVDESFRQVLDEVLIRRLGS